MVLSVARGRLKHRLIRRVQQSHAGGAHRALAGFTHAALVVSGDGDLVEVSGGRLRRSHLREYRTRPLRILPITASDEVRRRVVARAEDACAQGAIYDAPAVLGIAVSALTGFSLALSWDGAYTCSGFVAHALAATGAPWDRDPAQVIPAQLASHLLRHTGGGAPELSPPHDPEVRPVRTGSACSAPSMTGAGAGPALRQQVGAGAQVKPGRRGRGPR